MESKPNPTAMNNKELKRASTDYAIKIIDATNMLWPNNVLMMVAKAFQDGYRKADPEETPDEVVKTDYSHHRSPQLTRTDVAQTMRRMLQHLKMASLEMESFIMDDRIRPETRKAFQRYKERNIDWTLRQIRTDMKKQTSFQLVQQDLEGEKARDLQELIDFVLQYENIWEITAELKAALTQPKNQ